MNQPQQSYDPMGQVMAIMGMLNQRQQTRNQERGLDLEAQRMNQASNQFGQTFGLQQSGQDLDRQRMQQIQDQFKQTFGLHQREADQRGKGIDLQRQQMEMMRQKYSEADTMHQKLAIANLLAQAAPKDYMTGALDPSLLYPYLQDNFPFPENFFAQPAPALTPEQMKAKALMQQGVFKQ